MKCSRCQAHGRRVVMAGDQRAVSVMLGALAQVVRDLVSGDLCGTSFPNAMGGRDDGRQRDFARSRQ